ncbi:MULTISPECIES: CheR family methyltransferase [Pseudomonas]|uniref:CheR family methyltransferase n=1 Tax=Pseudomonas TaxID=286 RepID=UPI001BEC3989|nr:MULTISPECIES: CheR family methyltransferase [Pseudomonas]MBT2339802.1 PAS domain-containing protein [Pseudomonas fluorescens]MCD4529551.1 PAS domain-containing protein [Pseudomonas sp. C3-2018]
MNSNSEHPTSLPQRRGKTPSHLAFPVVGIGASAGGLGALKTFFEQMSGDCGMAFVIILHLSPDHESVADKIIQDCTPMPVQQVTDTCRIERNHVYVISPASQLSMNDGYLKIIPANRPLGSHVAIDLFFRDLADVHKEHAFCVVLSGTGSDGAVGLSRIKEQGGVTLVQSPTDAEYEGMPQAAIATGMVDVVLPVIEMPHKLLELWRNSRSIKLPPPHDMQVATVTPEREREDAERVLQDILLLLRNRTGHDFKHYKRATVLRRIERRLQVTAQPDLPAYLDYLESTPDEAKLLLGDMLIGVTNFFRDREAFEALERHVLTSLMNSDSESSKREEVRIWSAGCSTGEEAYSLTILCTEHQKLETNPVKVQVFATDIDERAIAVGRAGSYSEAIITDVPPTRLRQYFIKEGEQYRVRKEIREKVLFAKHSLLCDPPFSQIDLIVCRNLLIYLDRNIQREMLQMFHFALRPGGYLFMGSSETADAYPDLFTPVDKRNRIFRAKAGASITRRAPTMPRGGFTLTNLAAPPPMMQTPRKFSYADIHNRAMAQQMPPSMIVDTNSDILHMNESVGRFLRYVTGEVTRNVLVLIMPQLRLELRTTLFQQSGNTTLSRKIRVEDPEGDYLLDIMVRPYRDEVTDQEVRTIVFNVSKIEPGSELQDLDLQTENMVLSSLENELQRTKLHLQETIEQSEVSSEELKASNEEMQAINEELRSASEELETSKEELQSINEELLTVNYELKTKVEETDKINDYLANLIASTDIATVFVDRNMHIRWFTPRSKDIFSMLPVDTGRSLLDITHRLNYPQLAEDACSVFEKLTMLEREVSSTDNRWYIARLLPYRSSENHIDGTVLTFIDITKRREAEEDLRLGQERMRLVAESTHDYAIIIVDEQGLITDWNTGAEMIFGYKTAEIMGSNYDVIFSAEDRKAGIPEHELRQAREHGRAEDERWHVRKDGSRFYCSGEVSLLRAEGVRGYVKIARDLTGHKRLHEEQSKRLAETQSSSLMKDEFFAIMSHELKHPLNLIQLNTEILRRLPAVKNTANAAKAVSTISDAVSSQARIIDDLLDVARIRTGKLKLKPQPLELGSVLRDIHAVVTEEYPSAQVTLELPEPASAPIVVDADPTRLEQIVWNLVQNALKFSPEDARIRIVLSQAGGSAQLDVIDNGVGLSASDLEHVFELFKQATSKQTNFQRDGLGIGLSLVRQLAQAHGGSVIARSAGVGHGCTFSVLLPLSNQPLDEAGEGHLQLAPAGRLKGLKVLLVDDSEEVLDVMRMLLEMEDALVKSYSNPVLALEKSIEERFDVILTDIGMPEMDGHALISSLRHGKVHKYTPAIALSGYGVGQDAHEVKDSLFDRRLTKPVQYDELVDTIEALCQDALS